ncbi:PTS sugar transporter subunit IIA [Maledivibacter halophilus]|uniref:PTS system IIA component, Gat family (TC 4.A.5) n=1 Tax=Maledivibacter halophilus TaxID=36842 RepID=A0A1T5M5N5_9FIRM|nr:PTS sugar transporter subunit IIA [Maledivibacter halophilus]SKC83445.1 PTS system IIA component, Gat family (TC 4.A.5) [Maledivibacter halophilus]
MNDIYFNEELILKDIEGKSNEEILKYMANNLYHRGFVKESYVEAVIERERNFSTGLPTKSYSVAIPHTDIEHVKKAAISVGVLKSCIDFGIMGEESTTTPVKIVFMLAMNTKHSQLDLLKKLMKIFQDEDVLQYLITEKSKTNIKNLLKNKLNLALKGGE